MRSDAPPVNPEGSIALCVMPDRTDGKSIIDFSAPDMTEFLEEIPPKILIIYQ